MRALLTAWGQSATQVNLTTEHAALMGLATPEQVAQVSILPLPEAERLFLRLMIRHHQGPIAMVTPVKGSDGPAEVLARRMHAAQAREIKQMTCLLAARGAQPWPPLPVPAPSKAGTHWH